VGTVGDANLSSARADEISVNQHSNTIEIFRGLT
jgi:hypothetical protein